MKKCIRGKVTTSFLLLLLSLASSAAAADGAGQWLGAERNGNLGRVGIQTRWSDDGLPELWRAPIGEGFAAPAVARGRVFIHYYEGGKDVLRALDEKTGRELWSKSYTSDFKDHWTSGPRSSPIVDGQSVYTNNPKGKLYCWNAADGRQVWHVDLMQTFQGKPGKWGFACTPLIEGNRLFVVSGGKRGSLVCLDKRTGRTLWATQKDEPGYSSPVACMAGRLKAILFFTARGLVAVEASRGAVLWRHDWKTSYDVNAAVPQPVGRDKVLITSGYGVGSALLQFNERGVRELWKTREMDGQVTTPVIDGTYAYGFRGRFGKDSAELVCLDLRTGQRTWSQRGFKMGQLILVDGHLIVQGENGKLACVRADPRRYVETGSMKPFRQKAWTVPVLAGGRLYVRDQNTLLALDATR